MEFIRFFMILIVPGFIGALLYSIISRLKEEIDIPTALIMSLFIFIINITGLYFIKGITTMSQLLFQFTCLSFTRRYALLSILIAIIMGVLFGFIRRFFFWIRR